MAKAYEPGRALEARGERWTLARAQAFGSCTVLTLNARDRANSCRCVRLIEPFDRPRTLSAGALRRRPRRAVLRAALGALTSARAATGLWMAARVRMDVLPYQLEPALAVLGGATRLLLADAVGLGKTIQAGLVIAELLERGWIERALIVCPAGLRDTWATELRDRFSVAVTIADQTSIAERTAQLPPGVNPWTSSGIVVASVDFIKRPEVMAALQEVAIDLLIADEAHHLAPGTDRGAAVSALAARSPWCVLVSATPHSGDVRAFDYLTSLGAHGDRLAVFRRTRRDVGFDTSRRAHFLPVTPTNDERRLFDTVNRYVHDIWHARGIDDHAARLVAITIARRSVSSIAALTRTLRRRLELLGTAPAEPAQPELPWIESDAADDGVAEAILAVRGLHDEGVERAMLEQLLLLSAPCVVSSKLTRLQRLLHRIGEPALVFTEYRDTLDEVAAHLRSSRRVAILHGGLAADLRRGAVEAFNAGHVDVLVATDAAGEGLNLQRRCRLVIDYELPWNPVRLEQRAGRVDRIGQAHTVHAIRLFHAATIESRVLDHLQLRSSRAASVIDRIASEMAVATATLGGQPLPTITMPILRVDRLQAGASEAARAEAQRRASALGASADSRCWSRARQSSIVALVHRVRFANAAGIVVGERVHGHLAQLRCRRVRKRDWPVLIEHLSSRIAAEIRHDQPELAVSGRLLARIASIKRLHARQRSLEYQRSLFDQRAEARASRVNQVADALDAALTRVADNVSGSANPEATTVELIAAWSAQRP